MNKPLCQTYLDRFAGSADGSCSCGRPHSLVTRAVWLGHRVLEQLAAGVVDEHGPNARVWILSDENTRAAAGEACREALGGMCAGESVLPRDPRPRMTLELADRLTREAGACRPTLVLAVGGGTISDLGKMVSLALDVPNWCVATAPSVDAYGSATAATKTAYRARAVPGRPSERIVCDLEVLARAPRRLFLAGLGDLLAKFLAFLDWNLAALVTGEYFCAETAAAALESARRAIGAAARQPGDLSALAAPLIDALVTSSFAMQAVGNSRPASSTEHTVGHFWEISHAIGNPERELHGLLVGLASRLLLSGYSALYTGLPLFAEGAPALEAQAVSLEAGLSWKRTMEPAMRPFERWMAEESNPELYTPRSYLSHLERYREHRDTIEGLARETLAELAAAVAVLVEAGYPFRLEDYGLALETGMLPFRYVRALRNRYGSFNLMYELGRETEALERIRIELESLA